MATLQSAFYIAARTSALPSARIFFPCLILFFCSFGCKSRSTDAGPDSLQNTLEENTMALQSTPGKQDTSILLSNDSLRGTFSPLSKTDHDLLNFGLVDVGMLDTSLNINLAYSGTDNFLGEDIYGDLSRCYLQPEVADMLIKAHEALKIKHPRLRFLLLDGARPLSVQKKMWDLVKGTPKSIYVSNPKSGSLHNFGCAIDLTIVSLDSGILDMGTPFDFFGPEAQPRMEQEMLAMGKLSTKHVFNRSILSQAMHAGGFGRLLTEWWHYNAMNREEAARRYRIVP